MFPMTNLGGLVNDAAILGIFDTNYHDAMKINSWQNKDTVLGI